MNKKTQFEKLLELALSIPAAEFKAARVALDRLQLALHIYILIVVITVVVCWWINISGFKSAIHGVIILFVPISLFYLAKVSVRSAILKILFVFLFARDEEKLLSQLPDLIEKFCYVLSSITYAAIWPMILLTYLDFSLAPKAYWTMLLPLICLCLYDSIRTGSRMRIVGFFVFASPSKLFLQIVTNAGKLVYALSGF